MFLFSCHSALRLQAHVQPCLASCVGAEFQTQVLMLIQQVLMLTEPFPSALAGLYTGFLLNGKQLPNLTTLDSDQFADQTHNEAVGPSA